MVRKAVTLSKTIAALTQHYLEDTKRWKGKTMPENVKEDRRNKRKLLKELTEKQPKVG